jgi:hypothetical protein
MGVNLKSKKTEMRLDNFAWAMLRTFAESNGWIPEGTKNPDPSLLLPKEFKNVYHKAVENWPGFYHSRNKQTVSASDANHMADALRAGIEAVKNGERDADLLEMFFTDEIKNFFEEIPPAHEIRKCITELSEKFLEFYQGTPFIIG